MAVRMLKDGRWICYYRVKDPETGKSKEKREYYGRGVDGQTAAQARHDSLGLQKRRPAGTKAGPTFKDLADSYLKHRHMAIITRDVLLFKLSANILPFFGHRAAMNLRYHDLDLYIEKRRKSVRDTTICRELTDIQAVLNFATARKPPLLARNPLRGYKKPAAFSRIIPPPSAAEVSIILENASKHLRRAILLSYYLGLRPGPIELLSLTWLAVNWETETIIVTSAHKGGPEKRAVPLHPGLIGHLKKWYESDKNKSGPIIHFRGQGVTDIRTAWRNALRRANITRGLRFYDIRHAFATAALEQNGDIKALSEIMGSSPATLMKTYQHVSTQLRKDTVAKIPGLPGLTNCDQENKKAGHPKG